jgi:hypothetical protein
MVKSLISNGATVNKKIKDGTTPLIQGKSLKIT